METPRLTPTYRKMVDLVVNRQFCTKEIAEALKIDPASAKIYFDRLYKRIGVHSRVELYAWALKNREAWT